MRPVVRRSVLIERPVDEVWRFVADLTRYPRWFPGVLEMASEDGLPPATLGKRYRERVAVPLRGEEQVAVSVVECIPGQKLAIHGELAPALPRFDLDLRDVGSGHTRLQWTCRARNDALWVRAAVLPPMRRLLAKRAVQGLETLKRLLEFPAESMAAVQLVGFGAPQEVLRFVGDAPLPELHPDDVLVQVMASSLNPLDFRRCQGYGRRLFARRGARPPLVLGHDLSGVVVAAGSAVRRFRPGDPVWGACDVFRDGAWAEYVAVRAAELAPKPAGLGHEEAASLPYVALTTWRALAQAGLGPDTTRGKRVLVHAGSGGVGSFAIQLLKAWGAWVATTCRTRNREWVGALGPDQVIDTTREDFSRALSDLDAVLDTLGGELEADSLATLARGQGAAYVSVVHPLLELTDRLGLLPGALAAAGQLAARKTRERLVHGRRYDWTIFAPDARALGEVGRLVEAGRIRPLVDRSFPLREIHAAHRHWESGGFRGKIVLTLAAQGAGAESSTPN